MSATDKTWSDNNPPTLNDDDLNGFKLENNNLIVGAGLVISTSDNQQTHKAVSIYSAGGDFYNETGAVNAYVLDVIGARVAPPAYFVGMRVRFVAGNANTGASTANVDGLGVKALVHDATGAALKAGDIPAGSETVAVYDGTSLRVMNLYIGKQTIWIPAAAMQPTVSNGCAFLTAVETTAGRPDLNVLDFDASADEHAQFQIAFPKQWNKGTVTFQLFWTTANTGTEGIAMALQGVAVSDDGTIDIAYGTAIVVTDDNQGAAEDLLVSAESAAITIAGTPADGDTCFFRIFRDVADGNDDMTEDARLIGIKVHYTTTAGNDS